MATHDTHKALKDLINWVPEGGFPETAEAVYDREAQLDEIPFISEAFTYELFGKEDARSFLSRINKLCITLGFRNYRDLYNG